MGEHPESQRFDTHIQLDTAATAIDTLAANTTLSRIKLKDAMQKGAVWLRRTQRKSVHRLRRAKTVLNAGDELWIYFDPRVLAITPPTPLLLADEGGYSVWDKPAGMLSQGSRYGDHCALTRWIEKHSEPPRAAYVVHRLDQAASGLMLVAHDAKTAAALSALLRERKVEKRYAVEVVGRFDHPLPLRIEAPLDGKQSISTVYSAENTVEHPTTTLGVDIETGRKHQIRRHLAGLGFPVVGDTRYGSAPPGATMALRAVALRLTSPLDGSLKHYQVPVADRGDLPKNGSCDQPTG